jgi:hypothetical protein
MNKTTEEWKEFFNLNKKSFSYLKDDKDFISYYALVGNTAGVLNYPYGYKKTLKVYTIETTKRGDRLSAYTIHPNTQKKNADKKSVYAGVKLLIVNEDGHLKTKSLNFNDSAEYIQALHLLNDKQKIKLAEIIGYTETMKHVSFSCEIQHYKHKITGKIETSLDIFQLHLYDKCDKNGVLIDTEKEQKKTFKTKQAINVSMYHNTQKALKELQ